MKAHLKNGMIGVAMLAAAAMAYAMKPTQRIADSGPKVNLETMIPKQFGDWQVDNRIAPVAADPQRQAVIDKIYNQTLSRTYLNRRGQWVMISVAYGGDQSESLQVHKPEVCYTAQGFQVLKAVADELVTEYGKLPIKRLLAIQGARNEPIIYWFTVGNHVASTGLDWKLHQIRYGLTGKIPDGMLVRVSSIDSDEKSAYEIQERFVHDLLQSLNPEGRARLIGTMN